MQTGSFQTSRAVSKRPLRYPKHPFQPCPMRRFSIRCVCCAFGIEFGLKNHSNYSCQCAKYMVQLLNVHLFLDPRRIGSGFLKIDSVFLKIGVHVCRNYNYYIHSHYHYHCVVMVVFMIWAESRTRTLLL